MKTIFRIASICLPVVAVLLVIAQVVVTNGLASEGKRLGKLDFEVSLQEDIHEDLATQVASASSLFALRERAQTLGFREPTQSQIVTLVPEVPVALRLAQ